MAFSGKQKRDYMRLYMRKRRARLKAEARLAVKK